MGDIRLSPDSSGSPREWESARDGDDSYNARFEPNIVAESIVLMDKKRILSSPCPPGREPGAHLLETDRLIIRRSLLSDAPAHAAAADHECIAANLRDTFPSPYSLSDAESFLGPYCKEPSETGYPGNAAIFVKPGTEGNPSSDPLYVGAIGVVPKGDVYYRTWELGYWLTPSAWGKGYATEAVRAAVEWMFKTWPKLNRVEAVVYTKNEQSANVLRKAGFVEEGRPRQNVEKRGEILGEILFGLIRSDLEATQTN